MEQDLKVILLAAGEGSRLRPITDILPKCLVPINGIPLIDYWLGICGRMGSRPIVNTHYMAGLVERYFEAMGFLDMADLVREERLLNTGGTVKRNYDRIRNDRLMLVHADNLSLFDTRSFVDAHIHRPPGTLITMMTFRTDMPETCGIVELDSAGMVVAFHEKVKNPPGNLANAAVYIMEPEVVDRIASMPGDTIDFSLEILPAYMGRIATWENTCYHRDIGNPGSLLAAQTEFTGRAEFDTNGDRRWAFLQENSLVDRLALAISDTFSAGEDQRQVPIIEALSKERTLASSQTTVVKRVPVGFSSHRYYVDTGSRVFAICSM